MCARCGREGRIVGRDPDGRPCCQRCKQQHRRDRDDHEGRDRIVAAVLAAAPGSDRAVVEAVLGSVTVHARSLRRIVRHLDEHPDVFATGPTHEHRTVGRFVDGLIAVGVDLVVSHPVCGRCDRPMPMSQRRPLCSSCANKARSTGCAGCGRVALVHSRDPHHRPWCERCVTARRRRLELADLDDQIVGSIDVAVDSATIAAAIAIAAPSIRQRACLLRQITAEASLTVAARRKPVTARLINALIAFGVAISPPTLAPRRVAARHRCPRCDRPTPGRNQTGCRACIDERAATGRGDCATCDRRRVTVDGHGRCGHCARWANRRCDRCGTRHDLVAAQPGLWCCHRCLLAGELDRLTAGSPPVWVVDICAALRDVKSVASTRAWLESSPGGTLLTQLAVGDVALSHATLDQQPNRSVERLRGLLIAVGALEPDQRALARIETKILGLTQAITDPADRRVVVSWLRWHALARLRRRVERGASVVHSAQNLRGTVIQIVAFFASLHEQDRTLQRCQQSDVDRWFAQPGASPTRISSFLHWAQRHHHLPAELAVPSRRPSRTPATAIDATHRWTIARRLVIDDSIDPDDRVAAALVVLYAQPLTRIATLSIDQLVIDDDHVTIDFGSHQIALPEPFAELARGLPHRRRAGLADRLPTRWLFPAAFAPDRHTAPTALGDRLRRIGIQPRAQRASAVAHLAAEIPPALLADAIGITARTAAAAVTVNGGNWTSYAPSAANPSRPAEL
ncbi:MAG: hypothetical protein AB7W59_08255 [Acidimicrobiia bacterium]